MWWALASGLAVTLWACGARAPTPEPTPPEDAVPLRIRIAASVEDTAILCVEPTWRMRTDYFVMVMPCLTVGTLREYLSVRRVAQGE